MGVRRSLDQDGPLSRNTPLGRNKAIRGRPNRAPIRDETIRPRDRARSRTLRQRLPDREARADRLTPPTIPLPTAHHPEQTIERGNHDSQTSPNENDARVDDEPFHNEVHEATATAATTTREPVLGAHTARVVERARKRNTIAETHFRSNLSNCGVRVACCLLRRSHMTSILLSSNTHPISSACS